MSSLTLARLAAMAVILSAVSLNAAEKVELNQKPDELEITINGKLFGVYRTASSLPKPFLMPVTTAAGVVLNRELNDPSDADHPHHKGMWNAIDEVNEVKFWAEKGPILNTSVKVLKSGDSAAAFEAINEWRHPETAVPQLTEAATITIHANRLLVYDMQLKATHTDVVFEDTKEGLFGFRVAPSMKEKNGGSVVASDGSKTTKECWGKAYPWIDYFGQVDGKTVGVAIMDHPKNFRPSRYHVRDYGLFSISPFGEKSYTNRKNESAPVHLKKGETLRLRYAMYFHDGDTEAANVAGAYEQFVKTAGN
jgi:VCBS repeat-containing protein